MDLEKACEDLWRGTVVLHEEARSWREECEGVLDMYEDSDSWELCSRTDRSVLSRGGFTSGSHPLLVCMMTDDVRREYLWTMMLADDIV